MMAWLVLILAGLFEIGWPVGLKLAQEAGTRALGFGMAIGCIWLSGWLLWIAQKSIPIGTAYAIWTGIGASGTFFVGVWFFDDPTSLARYLGVLLIIGGVALLKLAH